MQAALMTLKPSFTFCITLLKVAQFRFFSPRVVVLKTNIVLEANL